MHNGVQWVAWYIAYIRDEHQQILKPKMHMNVQLNYGYIGGWHGF